MTGRAEAPARTGARELLGLWLAPLVLAAGCAAPGARGPEGPAADFAVLETLRAGEPVLGVDLHPLQAGERRYRVVLPKTDAGRLRAQRGGPTDRYDATFAVREGEARTDFFLRDAAGDTLTPAVIAHDERAITLFDPPLLAAPAALPAGAPREADVAMRVVDARDPERERESGRAVVVIEYVDDQRLATPLGELRAQRVVVSFTARLRLARAERTTTYWLVPGIGVVAREVEETLSVLGLPARQVHERIVLEPGQREG